MTYNFFKYEGLAQLHIFSGYLFFPKLLNQYKLYELGQRHSNFLIKWSFNTI